ncbi:MAG: hypothetical protein SFV24_04445 [Gemmatimonadales bacterium]|nr:hypothetical protein [Gemmatimonadales bacterium]
MIRAAGTALLTLIGLATSAAAQGVLVAPHAVVIDHRTRSAAITLYNPGSEPAEVTIATFFGYPVTDSTGDFELATPTAPGALPSAAGWVEAYPRRTVIGPLERQTVRLLARTPNGLADGEYWTRIMITATGGRAPVVVDSAPAGIQVGLNLEVRTIIPLQYRKGSVTTGAQLERPRVTRVGDSLLVRARMVRQGNAAFVGTARGTLVDAGNRVVGAFSVPLAVYTEIDPRFTLSVSGLPAGRYRLVLELTAERADLPPEQILKASPSSTDVDVVLP